VGTTQYIDVSDTMVCRFYRSDDDCSAWFAKITDQGEKSGQFAYHLTGVSKNFRNYICHDWVSEIYPEMPPLPSEADRRKAKADKEAAEAGKSEG